MTVLFNDCNLNTPCVIKNSGSLNGVPDKEYGVPQGVGGGLGRPSTYSIMYKLPSYGNSHLPTLQGCYNSPTCLSSPYPLYALLVTFIHDSTRTVDAWGLQQSQPAATIPKFYFSSNSSTITATIMSSQAHTAAFCCSPRWPLIPSTSHVSHIFSKPAFHHYAYFIICSPILLPTEEQRTAMC